MILVLAIQGCKCIKILADAYAKKIKNEEFQILLNADYNSAKLDILDELVINEFNAYVIYEIEYKRIIYITDSIQSEMIATILTNTINNMPIILINKLYTIYGKKFIEDSILNKVQMKVIEYSVGVNSNTIQK